MPTFSDKINVATLIAEAHEDIKDVILSSLHSSGVELTFPEAAPESKWSGEGARMDDEIIQLCRDTPPEESGSTTYWPIQFGLKKGKLEVNRQQHQKILKYGTESVTITGSVSWVSIDSSFAILKGPISTFHAKQQERNINPAQRWPWNASPASFEDVKLVPVIEEVDDSELSERQRKMPKTKGWKNCFKL